MQLENSLGVAEASNVADERSSNSDRRLREYVTLKEPTCRIRCEAFDARNKNGLHRCKPLMCLVAGTGFEPVTFGL